MDKLYCFGIKDKELVCIPVEVEKETVYNSKSGDWLPFSTDSKVFNHAIGKVMGYEQRRFVYLTEHNPEQARSLIAKATEEEIRSCDDTVKNYSDRKACLNEILKNIK